MMSQDEKLTTLPRPHKTPTHLLPESRFDDPR